MPVFTYSKHETQYLTERDPVLGQAIQVIGPISREVDPDLFSALVKSMVSQQISSKAYHTIWQRMLAAQGPITPRSLIKAGPEIVQSYGMSMKKAVNIVEAAERVLSGELDLNGLHALTDEEVCAELTRLKGIGVWTAEMLMTFSMQRPDVISFGDLAIHRGMRMLYQLDKVDRSQFNRFRERYSPFASVASLYLWAISAGALDRSMSPAYLGRANPE